MKAYRTLVLTDHSGHSDQNSLYAIVQAMVRDERFAKVDVASRGLPQNDGFFNRMDANALYGVEAQLDFSYADDGLYLQRNLKLLDITDYEILLMRLPRPITDEYLYWLSDVFSHAVLINDPKGIVTTSTKAYLLNFPDLCPDMKLCRSIEEVIAAATQQDIVLKPLREYGGKGILKIYNGIVDDGHDTYEARAYLSKIEDALIEDGYLAMKYLNNVSQGDKRILVVGGKIMAASLRLPAEGSWLCNVAQGGRSVPSEVTPEETNIINKISPALTSQGILIYGVDTLVDDDGRRILSEINTLSIGGFPQSQAQTGRPIIQILLDKIITHTHGRS